MGMITGKFRTVMTWKNGQGNQEMVPRGMKPLLISLKTLHFRERQQSSHLIELSI